MMNETINSNGTIAASRRTMYEIISGGPSRARLRADRDVRKVGRVADVVLRRDRTVHLRHDVRVQLRRERDRHVERFRDRDPVRLARELDRFVDVGLAHRVLHEPS